MICGFCKTELNAGATGCPSCGAYISTKGNLRAARLGSVGSLIFMGVWCNTVGFVWLAALVFSFFPLYEVAFKDKSLLAKVNHQCVFSIEAWHKDNPSRRFTSDAAYRDLPATYRFSAHGFNGPISYLPEFEESKPTCPNEELRIEAQKELEKLIANAKAKGREVGGVIGKDARLHSSTEKYTAGVASKDVIWRLVDYLITLLFATLSLALTIPVALLASKIWNKIFGDSAEPIWVR